MDELDNKPDVKTDEKLLIPGIALGVVVFGLVTALLMIPAFQPFDREDYQDRSMLYQDELSEIIRIHEESAKPAAMGEVVDEPEADLYKVADAVVNPARGSEQRIAAGKEIYLNGKGLTAAACATCHVADGSGSVGPSLKDNEWFYAQGEVSDAAMFRYVAFASLVNEVEGRGLRKPGQMQSYNDGLSPDEIWNVLAYIETLVEDGYTAPSSGGVNAEGDEAVDGEGAETNDTSNA